MARKTDTQAKITPFVLSGALSSKTDISHLLRELAALEDAQVGKQGEAAALPGVSDLLNQTAATNGYNLQEPTHRARLVDTLTKIHDHAPVVHISFAAEPPPKVVQEIIGWLRGNVHRYILLQVGLVPAIAAGCVLRTPNKIFDMSLRGNLEKQKPYLLQLIKGAAQAVPTPAAQAPAGKP